MPVAVTPLQQAGDVGVNAECIDGAHSLIASRIRVTPTERSEWLHKVTGCETFLKLENFQRTGSFKVRGALNAILRAPSDSRIITASSGNHGAAVAWALLDSGRRPVVYVPATADQGKIRRLLDMGAEVLKIEGDATDAEAAARSRALRDGGRYISPYNDSDIICGQGTVAREFYLQAGPLDFLFVAVGGGGLIGGMATWLEARSPTTRIIGCSPANSAAMASAVSAGHIYQIEVEETLSDGTSGGIENDSITFPICQRLIDDWVSVTEDEIAQSVRGTLEHHHMLIEGAAGVAVAAAIKYGARHAGHRIGIVLCGANISPERLRGIL